MKFFNLFGKKKTEKPQIDINDLKFTSDNHIRYENGKNVSGNNKDCWRGINIKANQDAYIVTIYNLDGDHSTWGDNIQMAPKNMKFINQNQSHIKLKGFGKDSMGASFADYGLTLHLEDQNIKKITLHMFDRNIDIEYMKATKPKKTKTPEELEYQKFIDFVRQWNTTMPMSQKMNIAMKSDELNNQGTMSYRMGDILSAIDYYNEAIEIMPNNDDALRNLMSCYEMKMRDDDWKKTRKKLEYLLRNQ